MNEDLVEVWRSGPHPESQLDAYLDRPRRKTMAASKGKWHATEEGEVCLVEITERSIRSVVLCRPGDQLGPQEKRDNARLIAAAPEMLAALEAILAACNRDPHPCHYQIREAIDASRNAVLLAREGKDE